MGRSQVPPGPTSLRPAAPRRAQLKSLHVSSPTPSTTTSIPVRKQASQAGRLSAAPGCWHYMVGTETWRQQYCASSPPPALATTVPALGTCCCAHTLPRTYVPPSPPMSPTPPMPLTPLHPYAPSCTYAGPHAPPLCPSLHPTPPLTLPHPSSGPCLPPRPCLAPRPNTAPHPAQLAFTPTRLLWKSTRARRSLLERRPRNSLTNLLLYLRLSPQPPHCQASRFSRSGASSHVQRSMRPALQALASACVRPAEEMA